MNLKTKVILKWLFALILCSNSTVQVLAQEEEKPWSVSVGLDAVSDYWWRGLHSADVCLLPSVSFDYEKEDWSLSMGLWGCRSVSGSTYEELDLFATATWKGLSLSVANYFDCETFAPYNRGHALDVGLSYTFSERLPLTLSWYSILLGNTYGDVCDAPSYLELSYPFSLSVVDFNAAVGLSPFKSWYYETERTAFTNVSLSAGHEFELFGGTLPVSVQYLWNPAAEKHAFVASLGFYFSWGL